MIIFIPGTIMIAYVKFPLELRPILHAILECRLPTVPDPFGEYDSYATRYITDFTRGLVVWVFILAIFASRWPIAVAIMSSRSNRPCASVPRSLLFWPISDVREPAKDY